MTTLYDKEVITELDVNLFYRDYKIAVLDNKQEHTYDIHIITDYYKKGELNTLHLQEPQSCVPVDKFDRVYLTMIVTEFALWDELYGYNDKVYSFNVNVIDEFELYEDAQNE